MIFEDVFSDCINSQPIYSWIAPPNPSHLLAWPLNEVITLLLTSQFQEGPFNIVTFLKFSKYVDKCWFKSSGRQVLPIAQRSSSLTFTTRPSQLTFTNTCMGNMHVYHCCKITQRIYKWYRFNKDICKIKYASIPNSTSGNSRNIFERKKRIEYIIMK